MPLVLDRPEVKSAPASQLAWKVIVWNDDINTMPYVVFVFRQVFGWNKETATEHMRNVHEKGSDCVYAGTLEKAEMYTLQIKEFGLRVSMEK